MYALLHYNIIKSQGMQFISNEDESVVAGMRVSC
jgi:hypothetical protein